MRKWLSIIVAIVFAWAPAWGVHSSARARGAASQAASHPRASSSSSSASKKKTAGKKRPRQRRELTQKAPAPERISEIQSSLARNGFYEGEPNGKWDENTVSAMRKFQSANGLESTGKIDARSLQKLGLGSEIAGFSAPKPVRPSGSVTPAPISSAPPLSQQPAKPAASSSSGASSASTSPSPAADPKPHQL